MKIKGLIYKIGSLAFAFLLVLSFFGGYPVTPSLRVQEKTSLPDGKGEKEAPAGKQSFVDCVSVNTAKTLGIVFDFAAGKGSVGLPSPYFCFPAILADSSGFLKEVWVGTVFSSFRQMFYDCISAQAP